MRVLHINASLGSGGAAAAMERLHGQLLKAGHESRLMARNIKTERPHLVRAHQPRRWWWQLLTMGLDAATHRLGVPGLGSLDPILGNREHFRRADVVHCHNLHGGGFSPLLPMWASRRAPLVWTLHDAWALTGHCAFPGECEGWREACNPCPHPDLHPPASVRDTRRMFRIKRFVCARSWMHLVAPSRWLAHMARESPLLARFPVHVIPYGLDAEVFRPTDRAAARGALGLPSDRPVLLTGAFSLTSRRKGMDLLLQALRELKASWQQEIHLVTFGQHHGGGLEVPYPLTRLGYISNQRMLALVYSAADVFVCPSRAETFGQVLSESMACETPCVSFTATAIPEVIRDGETGLLARPEDPADLARCIRRLLENSDEARRMGQRGREVVLREYSLDLYARRYLDVYRLAQTDWRRRNKRGREGHAE